MFCKAREPPLCIKFNYLSFKFMYKNFSLKFNPVVRDLEKLEVTATSRDKRIKIYFDDILLM